MLIVQIAWKHPNTLKGVKFQFDSAGGGKMNKLAFYNLRMFSSARGGDITRRTKLRPTCSFIWTKRSLVTVTNSKGYFAVFLPNDYLSANIPKID